MVKALSSLFSYISFSHCWFVFQHIGMACSCPFKISLKNVQPSWTASQETVNQASQQGIISLKVWDLLTPLLASLRIENYHFTFALPKTASSHHIM